MHSKFFWFMLIWISAHHLFFVTMPLPFTLTHWPYAHQTCFRHAFLQLAALLLLLLLLVLLLLLLLLAVVVHTFRCSSSSSSLWCASFAGFGYLSACFSCSISSVFHFIFICCHVSFCQRGVKNSFDKAQIVYFMHPTLASALPNIWNSF